MTDIKRGDPVLVYAPSFYRERRVGIVLDPCKDHENSFRVRVMEKDAPIKDMCVNLNIGDTIERLTNLNNA